MTKKINIQDLDDKNEISREESEQVTGGKIRRGRENLEKVVSGPIALPVSNDPYNKPGTESAD